MTSSSTAPSISSKPEDDELTTLRRALDLPLLNAHGWNQATHRFTPDPTDRVFGYETCAVPGCDDAAFKRGLCTACDRRRQKFAGPRTTFLREPRPHRIFDEDGPELCLVCRTPGHERPSAGPHGLCLTCDGKRRWRGQTVEATVGGDERFPPAQPLTTFGRCMRHGCKRWAAFESCGLCNRCHEDWRIAGNPEVRAWRAGTPLMNFGGGQFVDLSPLQPRARTELLLAIQTHAETGTYLSCHTIQAVAGRLYRGGFHSITELADKPGVDRARLLIRHAHRRIALVLSDPDEEMTKDIWSLEVLGLKTGSRANLRFTHLRQSWLRSAAKGWAAEHVSRSVGRTGEILAAVGELSKSLASRDDRGEHPEALGRADIRQFLNRLARAEAAGRHSTLQRRALTYHVRFFLRGCRDVGQTFPGRPLAGLPNDFAILADDIPRAWRNADTPTDRALPRSVVAQLLAPDALAVLVEEVGSATADMIQVHIWTGRRPAESTSLEFGCLERDGGGDPVLRFDPMKQRIRRARIPIQGEVAAIIERQQARVRAAYPDTPTKELALWPRLVQNPRGTHPRPSTALALALRRWVDALPQLNGPDGRPFPRERVFPYAFRHSYAQRHADEGTPVDVLSALLVHDNLSSTQSYYHVPEKRKRMAAALVAPFTMDRSGHVIGTSNALDAVLARRQLGQIPVPLGWCTEPNNVKAHGHACAYRFRCLGCVHFRTDPSHLDDLRDHLQRLFVAREELDAAMPALVDWARNEAAPSEGEIAAVRELIRACERQLDQLDEMDREAMLEAITELRKLRSQMRLAVPDAEALKVQLIAPPFSPALEPDA